jgi:hypothetical protein
LESAQNLLIFAFFLLPLPLLAEDFEIQTTAGRREEERRDMKNHSRESAT